MKIGILINHLSEVTIIDMILGNHEFVIYRNQIDQYAIQSTVEHFTRVTEQGYNWLMEQGVECIFTTPTSELLLHDRQNIKPLFYNYINQISQKSLVGKIGFVGDYVSNEIIHRERNAIHTQFVISERQKKHRHFNPSWPIWFVETRHRATRMDDFSPRSWMINNLVKFDLHKLKDAAVDSLVLMDRSYLLIHKSLVHHTKQIKYDGRKILQDVITGFDLLEGMTRNGVIHINGNNGLLDKPKRKHWCKKNAITTQDRVI